MTCISNEIRRRDLIWVLNAKGPMADCVGESWECDTGTGRGELWFLKLSDRAGFAQLVDEVAGNARVRFTCFGDDLVVLSEDEFAHTIIEKAS